MFFAQANIGKFLAPLDDPRMEGFVSEIERLNALAEASPGFKWRLLNEKLGEEGENSANPFGADIFVNMSVWENFETFRGYVYGGEHLKILKRRHNWFRPLPGPTLVFWWIQEGQTPTLENAWERLEHLKTFGPTPFAFNHKKVFQNPGRKFKG